MADFTVLLWILGEKMLDPVMLEQIVKDQIAKAIDTAIEKTIQANVESLAQDPQWMVRVERILNQSIAQQTLSHLGTIDINSAIHQRVDESIEEVCTKLLKNFSTPGISDLSTSNQLTVMDETSVFENKLVVRGMEVVGSAVMQDLVVKGTINTDNLSWHSLADNIAEKTLNKISDTWREQLVKEVADQISVQGIDFKDVKVNGTPLVNGNTLSSTITETNIQNVGTLRKLYVAGETSLNETVTVVKKRLGINTEEPEMALSVWDEEVSITLGKYKEKLAYVGTNRDQGLVIGVNRKPQIEISADGMTSIKKLRIGVHQLSYEPAVPGWLGTKGDVVFNSNPGLDKPFAWVCLGDYRWQPLKSA